MSDDTEFIDAESFSGKEASSYKEIVIRHLSKISEICTREFCRGYWNKIPVQVAGGLYMSEKYVQDGRLAYINAVNFFHDILLCDFDEKMDKAAENYNKEYSIKDINKAVENRRVLFQELVLLLKRKNFMETGRMEG